MGFLRNVVNRVEYVRCNEVYDTWLFVNKMGYNHLQPWLSEGRTLCLKHFQTTKFGSTICSNKTMWPLWTLSCRAPPFEKAHATASFQSRRAVDFVRCKQLDLANGRSQSIRLSLVWLKKWSEIWDCWDWGILYIYTYKCHHYIYNVLQRTLHYVGSRSHKAQEFGPYLG